MSGEIKLAVIAASLLIITLITVCLIPVAYVFYSFYTMGSNTIIDAVDIPGTDYKAVVFKRDMGATTAESMQLSIIKKEKKQKNSKRGNIFITEGTFHIKCEKGVVHVFIDGYGEVYKQKRNYRGIKILYPD